MFVLAYTVYRDVHGMDIPSREETQLESTSLEPALEEARRAWDHIQRTMTRGERRKWGISTTVSRLRQFVRAPTLREFTDHPVEFEALELDKLVPEEVLSAGKSR